MHSEKRKKKKKKIKGVLLSVFREAQSASQDCIVLQQRCCEPSVIEDLHIEQVTHSLVVVQVEAVVYMKVYGERECQQESVG